MEHSESIFTCAKKAHEGHPWWTAKGSFSQVRIICNMCPITVSVGYLYLICPEMLFINGKELCALPVCPGFPDIQQPFWNCSFAAVAEYSQVWEKQRLWCTPMDVSHCTQIWVGTMSPWIVEHTWIACWVTLHVRSHCCLEALSVQQSILRMVYSSSKRKFPNALHTWTSDSFSSSLKLVSRSAPILFWHMSVTLWLIQMRGVWCSLVVVLWRNVWLIQLKRKNCFGLQRPKGHNLHYLIHLPYELLHWSTKQPLDFLSTWRGEAGAGGEGSEQSLAKAFSTEVSLF